MDRRRFLIRGIDDYERSLEATGLDSGFSDGGIVVDMLATSTLSTADDLVLDVNFPPPDGDQAAKLQVFFQVEISNIEKKTRDITFFTSII